MNCLSYPNIYYRTKKVVQIRELNRGRVHGKSRELFFYTINQNQYYKVDGVDSVELQVKIQIWGLGYKKDNATTETAYVCGHSADTGEPDILKL